MGIYYFRRRNILVAKLRNSKLNKVIKNCKMHFSKINIQIQMHVACMQHKNK